MTLLRRTRTRSLPTAPTTAVLALVENHFAQSEDPLSRPSPLDWEISSSEPVLHALRYLRDYLSEQTGKGYNTHQHWMGTVDWATVRQAREHGVPWETVAALVSADIGWSEAAPHAFDLNIVEKWRVLAALRPLEERWPG